MAPVLHESPEPMSFTFFSAGFGVEPYTGVSVRIGYERNLYFMSVGRRIFDILL